MSIIWNIIMIMKCKQQNNPVKEHAGHQWLLVRGNWGPHRAKYICADCDGKWVKWHSIKASVNKYVICSQTNSE
jgi:hypothetical protein